MQICLMRRALRASLCACLGEVDTKGLTTAAGLWLTAAIGVAAGLGRESTAVRSALIALVMLYSTPTMGGRLEKR